MCQILQYFFSLKLKKEIFKFPQEKHFIHKNYFLSFIMYPVLMHVLERCSTLEVHQTAIAAVPGSMCSTVIKYQ